MQKGIVVLIFANYLDDVLVWNYSMSRFRRGIEKVRMGFVPACICVSNSLKFRLSPKNCQTGKLYSSTDKVSASWTQKSRSEDQECITVSSISKNCH
jgi:hypothetical protein